MFVGSGIDYLSEYNLEDMELDLFNPLPSIQLNPETFMNYAPLAASLGPPGSGMRFGCEPSPPVGEHFEQRASWASAGARQPGNLSLASTSHCTPPQPSGNALLPQVGATPQLHNSSQACNPGDALEATDAGPGTCETIDAKAKLRDKNKRAQQRFRERKKEKAQEAEKYMSDLTAEMYKVRLEKSKLEERNQLLEKVLSLSKQDMPLPSKGILQLSPDTLKTISAPFGAKLEVLSPDETLPVSVLRTDPKSMTVREVKSMSLEQHVNIWKDYVSKLAVLLVNAKGDPDSAAGAEVQSTLQEAITMCSCKAMHDPYGLQHFFMARMEEGRRISKQKKPQPEAMAEMMANVLTSLKLTDQQKHKLMELRCWVLPRSGRLMRERERISKALQACTKDSHKQDVAVNSKNLSEAHVQAADLLAELYSNLKEDQLLMLQMSIAIWQKMMTPFQLANIVVQTYPWVPDTGALLNQLAEDEGQPSAIELLGFGEGSISGTQLRMSLTGGEIRFVIVGVLTLSTTVVYQ
ncbi:hypothetical protein WJX79_002317 [Trebouxia sp. C0005]